MAEVTLHFHIQIDQEDTKFSLTGPTSMTLSDLIAKIGKRFQITPCDLSFAVHGKEGIYFSDWDLTIGEIIQVYGRELDVLFSHMTEGD